MRATTYFWKLTQAKDDDEIYSIWLKSNQDPMLSAREHDALTGVARELSESENRETYINA